MNQDGGGTDSITTVAYEQALDDAETVVSRGLAALEKRLVNEECAIHVNFDCTAQAAAGTWHAIWLESAFMS